MFIFSEDRGAGQLLTTAQYNRGRPRSPSPPTFPEEMMGKEREIKVSQLTPINIIQRSRLSNEFAIYIYIFRSRNCFCSCVGVRVHLFSYTLARAG